MAFKSDAPVSVPSESDQFNLIRNMNGFGWDPDQGLFIPTDGPVTYLQQPLIDAAFQNMPR